jgi:tetratricopeptide (TPR) repeat protein
MPKLSPLQWLLALIFLAFYGFAVFAVTRDYYIRHPIRPAVAQGSPGASGVPAGHPRVGPSAIEAVSAIPQAITETNPDLLRQRAGALFEERRYAEAIPVYRRVLELAADDIETHNDLGLALYYTGDSTGALEVLRQGSAAGPEVQRIWLTLGFVTLQTGDRPKAREALGRARDLGADNPIGREAERLLKLAQDQ